MITLIYKFFSAGQVNRGTKTPLGRIPLRALATPRRLGPPREAGIHSSLEPNLASQTRRPWSRPHAPRPAGGARGSARPRCPGSGLQSAPAALRPDAAYPGDWPARPGRGAAGAGEGGGGPALPRAPPPARLHRGAPTCPARLLQRSGPGRSSPRGPARRRPLLQPPGAARPPPPPRLDPSTAPVSCQGSGRAEGPQARGGLGSGAGREGPGWGAEGPEAAPPGLGDEEPRGRGRGLPPQTLVPGGCASPCPTPRGRVCREASGSAGTARVAGAGDGRHGDPAGALEALLSGAGRRGALGTRLREGTLRGPRSRLPESFDLNIEQRLEPWKPFTS